MNKEAKINFRVSEFEKKLLQSKVRRAKMRLSDFCRRAVFDKEIQYVEGLSGIVYELNKIGTNINQIAVAANQGRDASATLLAIRERLSKTLGTIDHVIGGDDDSDHQTD
jgi:predicted PP-loop superfamily ATPase